MTLKDARTISPQELYDRRKQAVMLWKQGKKYAEIAPIVGVHRNKVGEWIKLYKASGLKALKPASPGRPQGSGCTLGNGQQQQIRSLLVDKMPDQLKLPFALWTREAVRQLIKERFGVQMPIRTVGHYLQKWGFTPQKPVKRAYERCDAAVRRWLDQEYPAIAAHAKSEGAEVHWADETGLRSDDVNGRGYAPKGCTPVRRQKGTPERINMISSITNQGKVRFMFYRGKMNSRVLLKFLGRLIKDADERKIYLILDNLPVHHSRPVKAWAEQHCDRIALYFLPSYSPDLNPDEYLNNDLKAGVSSRPDSRHKGNLERVARSHMHKLQKSPKRVAKYFEASPIQYAA